MSESTAQPAVEATEDATLLEQVMRETKITPNDEWYTPARDGMAAFFADLVKTAKPGEKVHASRIDKMIADIDTRYRDSSIRFCTPPSFSGSNRPGAA